MICGSSRAVLSGADEPKGGSGSCGTFGWILPCRPELVAGMVYRGGSFGEGQEPSGRNGAGRHLQERLMVGEAIGGKRGPQVVRNTRAAVAFSGRSDASFF